MKLFQLFRVIFRLSPAVWVHTMYFPYAMTRLRAFFIPLFFLLSFNFSTVQAAGWEYQNPLPTGSRLLAVWGASSDDIFAVGGFGTILHYNGNRWTTMISGGEIQSFDGVWGSSGSDVFAVGAGGAILHYDGSRWKTMNSGTAQDLIDVWGSSRNDVFTVGTGGTILHYDGSHWETMNSGGTSEGFQGVGGSSGNDLFAVGRRGTILHYDGHAWVNMNSGITQPLFEVWGNNRDAFAVGANGRIFHYDGSDWTAMTSGTSESLHGLWGNRGEDVFAVGERGTILHYNGSSWTAMSRETSETIFSVWGNNGSEVFAVGGQGTVLNYDGSDWTPVNRGTVSSQTLHGIGGSSGNDVFTVGLEGTILHYDGSTWEMMNSGTTQWLFDVWGSNSDAFAVGEKGLILHYDGSDWTAMSSGTTEWLRSVWGSNGNDVFAVGNQGTILHYDGSDWTPMNSGISETIFSVWGSRRGDVFAVGIGKILHYNGNGNGWTDMSSKGAEGGGFAVWGSSGRDVFVVGYDIRHYDGNRWTVISKGTTDALFGVWGSSGNDVFVVDEYGTILHYDGSSWTTMIDGTGPWLSAVWGSGNDMFAVGSAGHILYYNGVTETTYEEALLYIPLKQPCRIVNTGGSHSPFNSNKTQQSFLAWGNNEQLNPQRDSDGDDNLGACLPETGLKPSAIVANVTVAAKSSKAKGNVVAYSFGADVPTTSLVNFQANNIANSSIITLSPESNRHFTIQANINGFSLDGSKQTNVIVDALGYFYTRKVLAETNLPGLSYKPLAQSCQIVNTGGINQPFSINRKKLRFRAWGTSSALKGQRDATGRKNLNACLPEGWARPSAVMANVTVDAKSFQSTGHVVTFPSSRTSSSTSLVNFNGNNIANASIISLEGNRFNTEAKFFRHLKGGSKQAHVVVDAQGYFYSQNELDAESQSGLSYIPLPQPCRIVDTRRVGQTLNALNHKSQGFSAWGTATELDGQRDDDGGQALGSCQPKAGMTPAAVMANVTVAAKRFKSRGNVVAYSTGSIAPESSLVNFSSNNIANSSIISLNAANAPHFNIDARIYGHEPDGSNQADVIVDVIGYFYP